jgi:hypothetical protein
LATVCPEEARQAIGNITVGGELSLLEYNEIPSGIYLKTGNQSLKQVDG